MLTIGHRLVIMRTIVCCREHPNGLRAHRVPRGAESTPAASRHRMRGRQNEGLVAMSAYQALIVEDDVPTRFIYARVLRDAGFEILEAADGAQALQILQREVPDIVFLDMLLPRIPGVTLLNFLYTSPQHCEHTVAVVISAHQRFKDALARPHDRFLLKPVYPRQLRAAAFDALASASR